MSSATEISPMMSANSSNLSSARTSTDVSATTTISQVSEASTSSTSTSATQPRKEQTNVMAAQQQQESSSNRKQQPATSLAQRLSLIANKLSHKEHNSNSKSNNNNNNYITKPDSDEDDDNNNIEDEFDYNCELISNNQTTNNHHHLHPPNNPHHHHLHTAEPAGNATQLASFRLNNSISHNHSHNNYNHNLNYNYKSFKKSEIQADVEDDVEADADGYRKYASERPEVGRIKHICKGLVEKFVGQMQQLGKLRNPFIPSNSNSNGNSSGTNNNSNSNHCAQLIAITLVVATIVILFVVSSEGQNTRAGTPLSLPDYQHSHHGEPDDQDLAHAHADQLRSSRDTQDVRLAEASLGSPEAVEVPIRGRQWLDGGPQELAERYDPSAEPQESAVAALKRRVMSELLLRRPQGADETSLSAGPQPAEALVQFEDNSGGVGTGSGNSNSNINGQEPGSRLVPEANPASPALLRESPFEVVVVEQQPHQRAHSRHQAIQPATPAEEPLNRKRPPQGRPPKQPPLQPLPPLQQPQQQQQFRDRTNKNGKAKQNNKQQNININNNRGASLIGQQQPQPQPQVADQAQVDPLAFDVPFVVCNKTEDGFERFACPSPDLLGKYPCLEDRQFCDGYQDCPNGEDEDPTSCTFYKLFISHLDILTNSFLSWTRKQHKQSNRVFNLN